jgi:AcrR family transcriptional regulator
MPPPAGGAENAAADPLAAMLTAVLARLPERPASGLDRALDATSACLARHGLARTSMTDVAREMGVARSTLYRHFGSVEDAAWALLAREAWRFFDAFGEVAASGAGPRSVIELAVRFVRFTATHPVVARLLHEEPDFVGKVVTRHMAALVDHAAAVVTPLMATAMDNEVIGRHDPVRLAKWMGRVVAICILAPPGGDVESGELEQTLEEMLLPVLASGSRSRR